MEIVKRVRFKLKNDWEEIFISFDLISQNGLVGVVMTFPICSQSREPYL